MPDPHLSPDRADDPHAELVRFLEQNRSLLTAYCAQFVQDAHDREELEQLVMIRAWRGIDRFDGRSGLSTWLYSIARNTAASEYGRRSRLPLPNGLAGDETTAGRHRGPGFDESLVIRDDLRREVARLAQPFREAFELVVVMGMTQAEAAVACGISEATLRTRLWRARRSLRTALTKGRR